MASSCGVSFRDAARPRLAQLDLVRDLDDAVEHPEARVRQVEDGRVRVDLQLVRDVQALGHLYDPLDRQRQRDDAHLVVQVGEDLALDADEVIEAAEGIVQAIDPAW